MEAFGWALQLRGVSPLARLVALRLGDITPPYENGGSYSLGGLVEYTDAAPAEIWTALRELFEKAGVEWWQKNCEIGFLLPFDARKMEEPRPPNVSPCSIYVIAGKSLIKIGISRSVKLRMENLQGQAPEKLELVWSASGPRHVICRVEAAAHAELAAHRVLSEWFAVSPAEAVDVVKKKLREHGLFE